jgi:hypothetical protein
MKIKLTEFRAEPGSVQEAGCVIDLPDAEARDLIRQDRAVAYVERAVEAAAPETTAAVPPANAAEKKTKRTAAKKPPETRNE